MASDLIINVTPQETRVALLEDGVLVELFIEYWGDVEIVGNIYKGRVVKILPGIQAAFVDIGLDRSAFLYVSDVPFGYERYTEEHPPRPEKNEGHLDDKVNRENGRHPLPPIESMIHEGQEIVVQVLKGPIGTKGARLTSQISLPGRYLVMMPNVDHIGISRRIENEAERARLKGILESLKPAGVGFIARTASENRTEEDLQNDMKFLMRIWENLTESMKKLGCPSLHYTELSLTLRAIRDLYTDQFTSIVVDSQAEYNKIQHFFQSYLPDLPRNIVLYDKEKPIFDTHGIEMEIERSLGRKVWLKSGGYIIIDQTEALTTVDVNTGKYVGKRNLEETILKTNLEAVKEIVYQIRLRNIGGIIIIDFIDMEKEANREHVYNVLSDALKYDRMKSNILKISELGLVEMTRKRVRDSLTRTLCKPCPYCEGKGYIKSERTVCNELFRNLRQDIRTMTGNTIVVQTHPDVASRLYDEEGTELEALEQAAGKDIHIQSMPGFHHEQWEIKNSNEK
jgi:ribonuclease G